MNLEIGDQFVNQELLPLQQQYGSAQQRLKEVVSKIKEKEERIRLMQQHMAQAQQLAILNQDLCTGLESQSESETNLNRVKKEEVRSAKMETVRLKKELKEVQLKVKKYEQSLLTKRSQLDDLQSAVTWEVKSCQSWIKESICYQEDNLQALQSHKEALTFAKRLSIEVEKLRHELMRRTKAKEEALHVYFELQAEIRRTSDDFSHKHQERQGILKLWEQSVRQLEVVDRDLDALTQELENCRTECEVIQGSVMKVREDLSREKTQQGALQEQLDQMETAAKLLSQQVADIEDTSQLESLKRQVSGVASEANSLRFLLLKLKHYIQQKEHLICSLEREKTELEASCAATAAQVTPEPRLLETLMEQERKNHGRTCNQRLRNFCDHKQQALANLKAKRQEMAAQLQKDRAYSECREKNLSQKRNLLDQKRKLLTNLELEADSQQKRLKRLTSASSSLPARRDSPCSDRLDRLASALTDRVARKRDLEGALHRTCDDVKKATKNLDNLRTEHSGLESRASTMEQDTDALQRTLNQITQCNKEVSVDNSLLQASVRQLQYQLEEINLQVLDLSEQQDKLQKEVASKMSSVQDKLKRAQTDVNSATAEKHRLSVQLAKEKAKLNAAMARVQVSVFTLPADIDEEHPASVLDKVMEAKRTQSTEEVQTDQIIQKKEQELAKLRSYLQTIQSANAETRRKCQVQSGEEESDAAMLDSELSSLLDALLEKRRTGQRLSSICSQLESGLAAVEVRRTQVEASLKDVHFQVDKVRLAVQDQEVKISRADGAVQKLVEEVDLAEDRTDDRQKYLEFWLLTRLYQLIKSYISNIARDNPDFYMRFYSLLQNK